MTPLAYQTTAPVRMLPRLEIAFVTPPRDLDLTFEDLGLAPITSDDLKRLRAVEVAGTPLSVEAFGELFVRVAAREISAQVCRNVGETAWKLLSLTAKVTA